MADELESPLPGIVGSGAWGSIVNAFANETDHILEKLAKVINRLKINEWDSRYTPDAYAEARRIGAEPVEEFEDISDFLADMIHKHYGNESLKIKEIAKAMNLDIGEIRKEAYRRAEEDRGVDFDKYGN